MVSIRPATKDDAAAIASIHVRSWQHAYRGIVPDAVLDSFDIAHRTDVWHQRLHPDIAMTAVVAELAGEVIGFASWGTADEADLPAGTAMLYTLYLNPQHIGTGVGSALLRHAEAAMAGTASLRVLVANINTRIFYEKHGWVPEPETERHESAFGTELHTVRYRKDLGPTTGN